MKTPNRIKSILALAIALLAIQSAYAFYNPQVGRWANRDPIGEIGGINLYSFAVNDPLNLVDPHGLDVKRGECFQDLKLCEVKCKFAAMPKFGTPGLRIPPKTISLPVIGPITIPGWTQMRFTAVYSCTDCCGNNWNETRDKTAWTTGGGTIANPKRLFDPDYSYTRWQLCGN